MNVDEIVSAPGAPRFVIYASGIAAMSVCAAADMTREEVEAEANREQPTGIDSPWRISGDAQFRTGEPHPAPCNMSGQKRLHWLLNC